jgi:hypothetical protein
VIIVAVAEAELDVIADVDLVRTAAAVNQPDFFQRGPGGYPAGPCPQADVGVALPLLPGERGEQDAGLVVVEDGGAGGVAQGTALCPREDVQSGCDGPGSGRDAPQRQRAAKIRIVLGGGDGARGARQRPAQGAGELVGGQRGSGGGERGQHDEGVGSPVRRPASEETARTLDMIRVGLLTPGWV